MKNLLWILILCIPTVISAQSNGNDSHPGKFYTIEKSFDKSYLDGYNLYVPNSHAKASKPLPVIVFLQGGLGVGGRVGDIFNWELPRELKETKELGSELKELKLNTFIYVMPHISYGQYYENVDALKKVLAEVASNYNIDENRIYLTGLSTGGHGAWGVASRMPATFAAVAPICGDDRGISDYNSLAKIPIMAAHNIADDRIDYNESRNIVQRIEKLSGKTFSRLSHISEIGSEKNHLIFISGEGDTKGHDAWTEVYNNVNFYKWLLRFRKE